MAVMQQDPQPQRIPQEPSQQQDPRRIRLPPPVQGEQDLLWRLETMVRKGPQKIRGSRSAHHEPMMVRARQNQRLVPHPPDA